MSFWQRLSGVVRSQINSLITESEDPEKVLEQAVMEMEQEVIEMRRALASAIATYKRTERQVSSYRVSADQWYERAQLALDKGNEGLARDALMRRQSYQSNLKTLQEQVNQQRDFIQKLKENLLALEKQYLEAKTKKNLYLARLRSANANQKFQEIIHHLDTQSTTSVFEQIEHKIIELDARSATFIDPLEERFMSLEDKKAIDSQLEQMKNKPLNPSQDDW